MMDKKNDDTRENLNNLSPEDQKQYMEEWFRNNYEDPAEGCPYNEGEYMYIYGGPYDAYEELEGQFSGEVNDELIEELAQELSSELFYWSGKENPLDYIDFVEPNPEYYGAFQESIKQIEEMITAKIDNKSRSYLLKLLYVNLITVLETYLSEAFVTLVFSDEKYTRNFIENNKDFQKQKIKLSNIFNEHEDIKFTIQKYLSDIIWHRLNKVEQLFKCTFDITFCDNGLLYKAIQNRRDLVHRSGKNDDDEVIEITAEHFDSIKSEVISFVFDINNKLHNRIV